MRARPVVSLDARGCVARGRAMLEAATDGEARIAGAVVRGPVVVLGARQRGEMVARDGETVRRATTGAEAWVGAEALWWSLALPSVNALMPDATSRTLINRNVRGFLRGLTACGALAHHFGRDVIAVRHRAAALLGYELLDDGRVLLDVIAGWSDAVTLPAERQAPRRATVHRTEGIALREEVGGRDAEEVLARVMELVAARAGVALDVEGDAEGDPAVEAVMPEAWRGAVRVPIGYVDAGELDGRPWLGGDILASTAWLARAEEALARGEDLPGDAVLEGARPEDLARAWSGGEG